MCVDDTVCDGVWEEEGKEGEGEGDTLSVEAGVWDDDVEWVGGLEGVPGIEPDSEDVSVAEMDSVADTDSVTDSVGDKLSVAEGVRDRLDESDGVREWECAGVNVR